MLIKSGRWVLLAAIAGVATLCVGAEPAGGDLQRTFQSPPKEAGAKAFWYWMNANATAEGITADLEAMAAVGMDGPILYSVGPVQEKHQKVKPPAYPLTDYWFDLVKHSIHEADRLGLRVGMHTCDGWSLSGGPWIKPETSMQKVVWAETTIEGGKPFNGKLNRPEGHKKYPDYRPTIAVLAMPMPKDRGVTSSALKPKVTSNMEGVDAEKLLSVGDPQQLPEGWIQYEFDQPFTARSIHITPSPSSSIQIHRMEVQVSDDGTTFRSLGRLTPAIQGLNDARAAGSTHSLTPTTARFFRFILNKDDSPRPATENIGAIGTRRTPRSAADLIELRAAPAIEEWFGKAGYTWRRTRWTEEGEVPQGFAVAADAIIDLTDKVNAQDELSWTPPPGEWLVQWFAYTTTGHENAPAGRGPTNVISGRGLESDKFNPEATQLVFKNYWGRAAELVGPDLAGRVLNLQHQDSWEAGTQNWSPLFRKGFIDRRGYDPVRYFPVMTGIPVESADVSERFLYDMRRTINEMLIDGFYKPMAEMTHAYGARRTAQPTSPVMLSDGLEVYKHVDEPQGEFWIKTPRNLGKHADVYDAVSGARIYGKTNVRAESFTSINNRWDEHPYFLKPAGDYAFALGVNRLNLHVWAQQADPTRQPGMTLGNVGTFFSGSQTWHRPAKAWFDYLKRSQAMLSHGIPVGDVLYFVGEDLPVRALMPADLNPPLPPGYTYHSVNRDALLTRVTAKDGKIVFPDGLTYSLLVLPGSKRMSPELARKIGELAQAGVPIIGSKPERSMSLTRHVENDQAVQQIVSETWGNVRAGAIPKDVLAEKKIAPDVEFVGVDMSLIHRGPAMMKIFVGDDLRFDDGVKHRPEMGMEYSSPTFVWIHRQTQDADFYFLSNQEREARSVDVAFRVSGKQPELWHPVTGEIRPLTHWEVRDGRTYLPLQFGPSESYFIVFRDPAAGPGTGQPNFPRFVDVGEVSGNWTVTFPEGRGAPQQIELETLASLSEHSDPGVKYFSGTATYRTTFTAPDTANGRTFLDLGNVANVARVVLNGRDVGTVWMPPFRLEITDALQAGENVVEIEVTNTWRNRLLGDSKLPKEQRITWRSQEPSPKGNQDPSPAGLLGPVRIVKQE